MALNDTSFTKNLSAQELQMLQGTFGVAMENTTLNWLVENNVQRYGGPGDYLYAYTITKNRVVRFTSQVGKSFGLQFSEDQNIFDLNPAQSIRSAMTETAIEKDIFVNLLKINNPSEPLDLPMVVSLLLHEFGHKLDKLKIQGAIDTLAAKIEDYLRSQINKTEVNGKTVYTLRYKNIHTYDQWVENILYGEYLGVNIPFQIHRLATFDKQGVYVWIDDHGNVTDISDRIKAEVRKNPKNDAAKDALRASYQNKIDLLSSVTEKTELMASLK